MSSGPARYEVSGERRKPKPSWSTSRVPSPKIASPFLAWCLRSAKTSSCLRRRLAPSSSLAIAMSTSSETCLSLRSDKCMPRACLVCVRERARKTSRAAETQREFGSAWLRGDAAGVFSWKTARTSSQDAIRVAVSDIAVNEGGKLRLGHGAHLGRLEVAVLEQHQGGDAADAVLGRRGLVLVDVQLGDLEAPR